MNFLVNTEILRFLEELIKERQGVSLADAALALHEKCLRLFDLNASASLVEANLSYMMEIGLVTLQNEVYSLTHHENHHPPSLPADNGHT